MDIQSLMILKAVAETGSFSAAARKLNYAQSHISTQIMHLEQELGTPLFRRHNRGIELSSAGEVFLQYANDMARIMDAAKQAMADQDKPSGKLRLAAMQTTAQTILPKALAMYHRLYPEVEIEVKTSTSDNNLRAVLDYDADIAFVAGSFEHSNLAFKPVEKERLLLLSACGVSTIHSAKDLEDTTLLLFPAGCAYRRRLESWLAEEGVVARDSVVFDSLPAILASVCAGLGVSLLPETVAAPYLETQALIAHELPESFSLLHLSAVYRNDCIPSPTIMKMVEVLQMY